MPSPVSTPAPPSSSSSASRMCSVPTWLWPSRSASRNVSSSALRARASYGTSSGASAAAGGSAAVTTRRTVSGDTPCATSARAASASGWLSSPSARCSGPISSLPAATASFCEAITTLRASTVNRLKPWPGSRSGVSPEALGTKRFCAACLLTPMLRPMSVQEAPERRAWSTKWPIRWSATSPRWSAAMTASESWSRASVWTFLMASIRSSRRTGFVMRTGFTMRQP